MNNTSPECTTIDAIRAYLHAQHGVGVGPEDPVLFLHTMFRVFLGEYERLLQRHHQAMTQVIGDVLQGLTEEALTKNLQDQVRLADRIGQEFEAQYKRVRLLSLINTLAAVVCLLVFIYLIAK